MYILQITSSSQKYFMTYFKDYYEDKFNHKITDRKKSKKNNTIKKSKYKMNGGREIPPIVRARQEQLERELRVQREIREQRELERQLREQRERELRVRMNQAVLDYHARDRANSFSFPCVISGGRIKNILRKKYKSKRVNKRVNNKRCLRKSFKNK